MVDYLTSVSWVSLILLIGIAISTIATKTKLPDVLFLLILGIGISAMKQIGLVDYELSSGLLITFSLFALVMIIFDSTSNIKIKKLGKIYPYSMKLAGIFLVLCVSAFAMLTYLFFFISSDVGFWQVFAVSAIFAGLMSGSSPSAIFPLLKGKKSRLIELIRVESLVNSTTSVIIPFLIFINASVLTF